MKDDQIASTSGMPLEGLTVIDLTTWIGGYAGRILSDLGADVVHVVAPDGVNGRRDHDVERMFSNFGKIEMSRGAGEAICLADVEDLLEEASILITDINPANLNRYQLHPDETTRRWPALIHVAITPYGLDGPQANFPATDLTLLADGGLLYLSGDSDRAPVRPAADQTTVVTSLHATVATLMAVTALDHDGLGQIVDVSAQEAVAHSLENAVQYFDCETFIRRRKGAGPAEAGVGLFSCIDGYVYILTTMGGASLGWEATVQWLIDEQTSGAEKLREPQWQDSSFRRSPEAMTYFRTVFEDFSGSRTKETIYSNAQARGISVAPVSEPTDLLHSGQLASRSFFHHVNIGGKEIQFPGLPYRFLNSTVGRFDTPESHASFGNPEPISATRVGS